MSVVDQSHGNYNNYLNNDEVFVNNNNGKSNNNKNYNNNNGNNDTNHSSFSTHLNSPSNQVGSLVSAQLVYKTPIRTSSAPLFRLQDPGMPPSRLPTPQLLSSFQNSNVVVNNDTNQSNANNNNGSNGSDAISFIIDIPDNPLDNPINAINPNENVIINVSPDGSLM
jgi:hypothetical protein